VGRVPVPDPRLDKLAELGKSQRAVPTQLEFVDIAGLVRGASKGEGLGNQFLGHIREVDAIAHVLRCFENGDIVHVEGSIDPIRDAETVETELMLADMDSLEKRLPNLQKKAKTGVIGPVLAALRDGKPARTFVPSAEQRETLRQLQLLTAKPVLYVCNVEEESADKGNSLSAKVSEMAKKQGASSVVISAAIEAEISQLASAEERAAFLESLGLKETGLARVIQAGYALLGLMTFFTVGPKEARAWTVHAGAKAPEAAGVIHTDFERGFIAAETIAFADYVALGGEAGAKEAGKARTEGRDYKVADGDVFLFRFNV